ncbi:MAG: hypothetical protein IPK73_02370 [Candidatus Obscuribacter sp.]|nr:hypothetical protein [Candidatus Obscuribacter sp.]MBK9280158.1 hypothetical protein [Candidatus Obscuribacter sp.]MBL8085561.1 hypothetical protein [Candidatus Obscuribacter sp.]
MISRETELYLKGMRLSPEDAEMLEEALNQDASNTKMRIQLIAYYYNRLAQSQMEEDSPEYEPETRNKSAAASAHQTHVRWITVNEPNHSVLSKSWAQLEP